MPFNNPEQPGVTRYPNLLPVQATGYPDGSDLSAFDQVDRKANARLIHEETDKYTDMLLMQIEAYCAGVGAHLEANPPLDLATFLLKKPALWVTHKQIFPKDCDKDWSRFTVLCARAYEGKLDDPEGQPFDVQHMRAVWLNAAMALGVIQPGAMQQVPMQGVA